MASAVILSILLAFIMLLAINAIMSFIENRKKRHARECEEIAIHLIKQLDDMMEKAKNEPLSLDYGSDIPEDGQNHERAG